MSDTTSLTGQVNRLTIAGDNASINSSQTESSELVAVVDDLLNQLTTKFNSISGEILTKMDDMAKRLDTLEGNIQAGNAAAAAQNESEESK
ncbi:hypothetical protein D0862_09691 [Lecanosticta acicola]|uniref:Heat shock factor binding protein 1 n=1 Tax=Lecanosticta acicola TaxID=111012 RepID=A0AAI9EFH7_9PEZI|nr:hypothetical protein D0862_09691 [Lecanosticta acicola]